MDRINKPKVFLSHSSLDKEFINRLAVDLRKCHIEPWLDTEEIRDGRPWLKMIFEDGIPTCDAVILYLTENSLSSKMVAKEMDATLVEQLGESGITLLPYVSKPELRRKLRADIRALHCREWSDANYADLLPTVVAEIWHSYTERVVGAATLRERNRSLELELELAQLKLSQGNSAFSPTEEQDFTYIQKTLSKWLEVSFTLFETDTTVEKSQANRVGTAVYKFLLLDAILHYQEKEHVAFDTSALINDLQKHIFQRGHPESSTEVKRRYEYGRTETNIVLELQTYGLLTGGELNHMSFGVTTAYYFTEKMYRFRYWLGYNAYPLDKVDFEYVKYSEDENTAPKT